MSYILSALSGLIALSFFILASVHIVEEWQKGKIDTKALCIAISSALVVLVLASRNHNWYKRFTSGENGRRRVKLFIVVYILAMIALRYI